MIVLACLAMGWIISLEPISVCTIRSGSITLHSLSHWGTPALGSWPTAFLLLCLTYQLNSIFTQRQHTAICWRYTSILLSRLPSPAHSLHSFHLVYHLFMTGSAIMAFLSIAASQSLYCLDLVNERAAFQLSLNLSLLAQLFPSRIQSRFLA